MQEYVFISMTISKRYLKSEFYRQEPQEGSTRGITKLKIVLLKFSFHTTYFKSDVLAHIFFNTWTLFTVAD